MLCQTLSYSFIWSIGIVKYLIEVNNVLIYLLHLILSWQTMFTESDLKELGLPMGPRKKLQGLLTENNEKKVCMFFFFMSWY